MTPEIKRRILFLCTGNCVRSQMADVLMNYRGQPRFEAVSAGSHPAGFVHAFTVQVLKELRIPFGKLVSKSWEQFQDQPFDAVITLCGSAREELCPYWPSAPGSLLPVRAHWGFDDPTRMLLLTEEQQLEEFRRVRNQIRECVEHLALAPDAILRDDASFAALIQKIATEAPVQEL